MIACGPAGEPVDGHGNNGGDKTGDDPTVTDDTDEPTPTDTDTDTDTDTTPPVYDCDNLPPNPRPVQIVDIQTEEDFDFDAEGYLIFQDNNNLAGRDQYGDFRVISPAVASDPSAVQVLSDGFIVVGAQDEGSLKLVDPSNGSFTILVAGLTQPNGVEIGSDDRVYFTEFTNTGRVRWVDRDGTQGTILTNTYMPNGIVLSPDEQILYVGGHDGWNTGAILAINRTGPDTWEDFSTIVYASQGHDFDAVEMDSCGNIYTVEYDTGRVLRISPDGLTVDTLADVVDPNFWNEYNTLRWGNDIGGWKTDFLYLTNRNHIFPIDIAIEGKPHPTMP